MDWVVFCRVGWLLPVPYSALLQRQTAGGFLWNYFGICGRGKSVFENSSILVDEF